TLNPTSGTAGTPAGSAVSVTGAGFNPADAGSCSFLQSPAAPVLFSAAPPVSCAITSSGQLSGSGFTVATTATPGPYIVSVKGLTGDIGSATFTVVTSTPTITLSPIDGPFATGVVVTGSGFTTSDTACGITSTPATV